EGGVPTVQGAGSADAAGADVREQPGVGRRGALLPGDGVRRRDTAPALGGGVDGSDRVRDRAGGGGQGGGGGAGGPALTGTGAGGRGGRTPSAPGAISTRRVTRCRLGARTGRAGRAGRARQPLHAPSTLKACPVT